MAEERSIKKLKVIEGYREPSSSTFDTSSNSINNIRIFPGIEGKVEFDSGKTRFYPWHRILNYETRN